MDNVHNVTKLWGLVHLGQYYFTAHLELERLYWHELWRDRQQSHHPKYRLLQRRQRALIIVQLIPLRFVRHPNLWKFTWVVAPRGYVPYLKMHAKRRAEITS